MLGEFADDAGIDGIGLGEDAFGEGIVADAGGREEGDALPEAAQDVGKGDAVDASVFGAEMGHGAGWAGAADLGDERVDGFGGVGDGAFAEAARVDGESGLGDVDADVKDGGRCGVAVFS